MATSIPYTPSGTVTFNFKKDPETTDGSAITLNQDTADAIDKYSSNDLIQNISNTLSDLYDKISGIDSVFAAVGSFFEDYWQLVILGAVAVLILRRR